MVCVPCIVIPVILWVYQNYLKKYLDPVLGPILGPILKPIYAKIEPWVGKYVPNAGSEPAKCPVSGVSAGKIKAKFFYSIYLHRMTILYFDVFFDFLKISKIFLRFFFSGDASQTTISYSSKVRSSRFETIRCDFSLSKLLLAGQ